MSEWRHAQWTGETKDGKRWCVLCRQAWPCDAEQMRLRAEAAERALRDGALPAMRFAANQLRNRGADGTADALDADVDKIEAIIKEATDAREG